MNNKTKLIVLNGIMIALVCITTMVIQIPIPMTEGYVNIGDSIIFVALFLIFMLTTINLSAMINMILHYKVQITIYRKRHR